VLHNLAAIRESGLEPFLQQQARRIAILENMLQQYDDGRSKSYYCIAAALLSIAGLAQSIQRAEQEINQKSIGQSNLKAKARILRQFLEHTAGAENAQLKLRKA
jgi:RecA/RadA recombinase